MKIESPKFNLELLKRFLHIPADRPNRAQIEITNRCNIDCKMCPRKDFELPYSDMSFEFFKSIMQRIRNVNLILPVGWGESFVHPDFDKIVDYLRNDGHTIKVTTNGLLLDDSRLRKTALKIDYLTFSLELAGEGNDSNGHNNDKIIQNIKSLMHERGIRKKPYICIQSVLLKNNKHVEEVIGLAKDLNVDRVNLVRPYIKFDKSLDSDYIERKNIYEHAEKLSSKLGVKVDMFEYATFDGAKRFFWKYFKDVFRVNSWCPRLYDFAYVTMDGKVTPCCALPRHIVGDLTKQSIEEIWSSEAMLRFRKNHVDVCKDCHVFKIK